MTTLMMILGVCMVGLGISLMDSGKPTVPKPRKPKKVSRRDDDDFWDYAWS